MTEAQAKKRGRFAIWTLGNLHYAENNSLIPPSPGGRGRGEGDIQYAPPPRILPRQGGG